MVRFAERFFTSLGFDPLPATFWDRSLFTKPADRDVMCHPSAWDIDADEDLRISYCIEITGEDFITIHHELGHNFYARAYRDQPFLYRDGANDGFHEAIGDAITLSMTPRYLVEAGLLDAGARGRPGRADAPAHGPRQGAVPAVCDGRRHSGAGRSSPARSRRRTTTRAWWDLARRYQGISRRCRAPNPTSTRRRSTTWPPTCRSCRISSR